jgi:hypothetical protein
LSHIRFSEVPTEIISGEKLEKNFLHLFNSSYGSHWYRPTTLSELSLIQNDHATFHRFMGGTAGYKREDSDKLVTVQLDGIKELVNNAYK